MSQQWIFTRLTAAAATNYFPPNHWKVWIGSSTEAANRVPIAAAGAFTTMVVTQLVAPGAGKSNAYTLMLNGSATGLAVTISNTNTTGSLATSISIAAGDTVSFRQVPTGAPAATDVDISLLWVPTVADAFIYPAFFGYSAGLPRYITMFHSADSVTGDTYANKGIAPFAGTITAFAMHCQTAPGGANAVVGAIRQNSSEVVASDTTITSSATDAITTGLSIAVAQYDQLSYEMKSLVGTIDFFSVCAVFKPATSSYFAVVTNSSSAFSNAADNYQALNDDVGTATESTWQYNCPGTITWGGLAVVVTNGRAGGTSYTITSRKNTAAGTISILLDNAAGTSANDFAHTDKLVATDLIDILTSPSSTPTGPGGWSIGGAFFVTGQGGGGGGGAGGHGNGGGNPGGGGGGTPGSGGSGNPRFVGIPFNHRRSRRGLIQLGMR